MKKVLISVAVLCLIGCGGEYVPTPPSKELKKASDRLSDTTIIVQDIDSSDVVVK